MVYNIKMNLTSPKIIKELLAKYETRPSKGLGQNFLIDENVLQKIITAANLNKNDIVLEVGPGIGTLTQELAQKAKKVIAIEKDKTMVEILKETLKGFDNVEVINGDILKIELLKNYLKIKNYKIKNYKIVANIPYYITGPLIRFLLENENQPAEIVLMVQKEVAQRICSNPPDMTLLSVSVQFYAEVKIISYVSKNCFWPSPKIDSAIIKITPFVWAHSDFASHRQASAFRMLFFKVVKAGFSHPRKQLIGNLSKILDLDKKEVEIWLLKNNIKPTQRAETLSIDDWVQLTKNYKK